MTKSLISWCTRSKRARCKSSNTAAFTCTCERLSSTRPASLFQLAASATMRMRPFHTHCHRHTRLQKPPGDALDFACTSSTCPPSISVCFLASNRERERKRKREKEKGRKGEIEREREKERERERERETPCRVTRGGGGCECCRSVGTTRCISVTVLSTLFASPPIQILSPQG